MTHLELHVTYLSGDERIVETDRDDTHGRRRLDAMAFAYLARPSVVRVRTVPVDRIAGGR